MVRRQVRRLGGLVTALVVCAALGVTGAPQASAAAPYCGQVWGSLAKQAGGLAMDRGEVQGIRAGQHRCYDRVVVDVDRVVTAWQVGYVPQLVADGSGAVVPVRGAARLQITVRSGIDPQASFLSRMRPKPGGAGSTVLDVPGYRTLREVAWLGSFEGITSFGVGVRGRLPFRVFVLPRQAGGSRLVVDVGHRWCTSGGRC